MHGTTPQREIQVGKPTRQVNNPAYVLGRVNGFFTDFYFQSRHVYDSQEGKRWQLLVSLAAVLRARAALCVRHQRALFVC